MPSLSQRDMGEHGFTLMESLEGGSLPQKGCCPLDERFRQFAGEYLEDLAGTGVDIILFDDECRRCPRGTCRRTHPAGSGDSPCPHGPASGGRTAPGSRRSPQGRRPGKDSFPRKRPSPAARLRHKTPASYLELFDMALRADGTVDGILKYVMTYYLHPDYEKGYVERHCRNKGLYAAIGLSPFTAR